MLVSRLPLIYGFKYGSNFSLECTLLSLLPLLLTIMPEMAFIGALNSDYVLHNLLNEYCKIQFVLMVLPETHKELKRITRVHSVRIFSLPSTIFGNTKRLYANDLLT